MSIKLYVAQTLLMVACTYGLPRQTLSRHLSCKHDQDQLDVKFGSQVISIAMRVMKRSERVVAFITFNLQTTCMCLNNQHE
jgi:hypothetical protein